MALPDAAIGTDYVLYLSYRLISGLEVDVARMRENLESTSGLIYTGAVLLDLVDRQGLSREDAYALTQAAAMETWRTGRAFRDTLIDRAKTAGITVDPVRLDEICRPERYVQRLDGMFTRLEALS